MVQIIADTGVIVGLVRKHDQWHKWTVENSARLEAPFFTCEAAVTEACFLLRDTADGEHQVLRLLGAGHLRIGFSISEEADSVGALMKKYKSVPMSFADACIVRMTELFEDCFVFTTDGDFRIYRRERRKIIPLIIPESA